MSGICGVYHTNLREVDRSSIENMVKINKYLGNDYVGIKTEDHIAFGYSGLRVTKQSANEIQPFFCDGVTLVADLRLDRRADLVSSLRERGLKVSIDDSDESLFYQAYKLWDVHFVDKLDGEFAFVIWDLNLKRLLCGRDHLGIKPLFYKWDGEQFLFSSSLEALLFVCPQNSDWNRDYFLNFIVNEGVSNGEETPYRGLNRLPGGHILVIKENKLTTHRYWNIKDISSVRLNDPNEYVEKFKDLFFQSVKDKMRSDSPVAVSLSGGLDSSSIFCTAHHVYSSIPKDHFFPVTLIFEKYKLDDERSFIQHVIEKYNVSPHWVVADNLWSYKNFPFDSPLTAEPHVNSATYFVQKAIYQKARDLGARIVLDGNGGDEVLSGSNKVISDYICRLRWLKAFKEASVIGKLRKEPFFKNLYKYGISPLFERKDAPNWLSPKVKQLISAYRPTYGRIARERQEKQIMQLPCKYIQQYIASPLGIESRQPFLDRRLVEFLISIPMDQKLTGSIKKLVLRKAMHGILPDPILKRVDKTTHHNIIYKGLQKEWPQMVKAFQKGYLAELGLVEYKGFLDALQLWRQGDLRQVDMLWTVVALELWFYRTEVVSKNDYLNIGYTAASSDLS